MALRLASTPEDQFVQALKKLPPKFLMCREIQHDWKLTSPYRVVDTGTEDRWPVQGERVFVEREVTCQRCTKVRYDRSRLTSQAGHTVLQSLGSAYSKVEGYAIEGLGNTAGYRGLIHGVVFDEALGSEAVSR